jgi:ribonuclease R
MVTVRDLNEFDEFKLDDADYALVGMRTGKKFRMGDAVRIKVVAANLEKRQLDYHWVQEGSTQLDAAKSKKIIKKKK